MGYSSGTFAEVRLFVDFCLRVCLVVMAYYWQFCLVFGWELAC